MRTRIKLLGFVAAVLALCGVGVGATAQAASTMHDASISYTCGSWISGGTAYANCTNGPGTVRVIALCSNGTESYGPWVPKGLPAYSSAGCMKSTVVNSAYQTAGG